MTASDAAAQTFERWDGKGAPAEARGPQIHLAARLVNLADVVEVFHRARGIDAAVARARSGTQFDPALVTLFCDEAPELFAALDAATSWDAVIAELVPNARLAGATPMLDWIGDDDTDIFSY